MAEQLTPITSLANNSVNTLIALANAIVNTMATTMVTANGSANGALTNGNGYISGIFGAATLVSSIMRGGNVQASSNLVFTSNVVMNSGAILYNGNVSISNTTLTAPIAAITNATVAFFPQSNLTFANCNITDIDLTTTGISAVTLDSWPLASYRSAEYIIQATDNTANNYQVSKLLVLHDGTNALFTEYGLLTTNNVVATFTAVTNSTTMIIQATSTNANASYRTVRTTLNV